MATNIRADVGAIQHDNYTTVAAASVATKTPLKPMTLLVLTNTHASNAASVSFDGGSNFYTLGAGATISLDLSRQLPSYMVKDAVDNSHATIQALYGSEA